VVGLTATFLAIGIAVVVGLVGTDTASALGFSMLAVAQAAALLAVLFRISHHQEVGFQTVMGGISAYALIAFVMASVYTAADLLTSGAFLDGIVSAGDFTYFSFITLTTVGYGDITPASELAKRLVVVEAFVGQVFLITLVARLVSLWGSPIEFRRNR
jgi:voltage-gated potassium channel Kch